MSELVTFTPVIIETLIDAYILRRNHYDRIDYHEKTQMGEAEEDD